MRKLASIQEIVSIEPIPGADAIEKATVLGWHVVVKKGAHKPGERVVYCEIDSLLPERPEFEFLRASCYKAPVLASDGAVVLPAGFRVKTIKLRGQVSQGIVFPLSILPSVLYEDEDAIVLTDMVNVGADVSDVLGVVKWELPEDLGGRSVQGMRTVTRPDFIPKTDETRVQNLGGLVKQCAGMQFVATEKLDGSSFTAFLKGGEFGICSRNQRIDPDDMTHAFCALAKRLEIEAKMRAAGDDFAIQGEVIGPKIQGNKYRLPNCDLYVFDVFDLASNEYASHHNMVPFVAEMGLQAVPFVQMVNLPDSVDAIVAMSEGKSALNPHVEREGIVLRPVGIMKNDRGERVSFKAINPKFLLKYEE